MVELDRLDEHRLSLVDGAIDVLELAQKPLRKAVPEFLPELLGAFIPLDGKNGPQRFTGAAGDLTRAFTVPFLFGTRVTPIRGLGLPGFGEIDHYRLLSNVAFTGRTIPLCCENISAPGLRARSPEEIDSLARRAREFLEVVIQGLHANAPS